MSKALTCIAQGHRYRAEWFGRRLVCSRCGARRDRREAPREPDPPARQAQQQAPPEARPQTDWTRPPPPANAARPRFDLPDPEPVPRRFDLPDQPIPRRFHLPDQPSGPVAPPPSVELPPRRL